MLDVGLNPDLNSAKRTGDELTKQVEKQMSNLSGKQLTNSIKKIQLDVVKTTQKVKDLADSLSELKTKDVYTPDFAKANKDIEKYTDKVAELKSVAAQIQKKTGQTNVEKSQLASIQSQIKDNETKLMAARARANQLIAQDAAYMKGVDSEDYAKKAVEYQDAVGKLLLTSSKLSAEVDKYEQSQVSSIKDQLTDLEEVMRGELQDLYADLPKQLKVAEDAIKQFAKTHKQEFAELKAGLNEVIQNDPELKNMPALEAQEAAWRRLVDYGATPEIFNSVDAEHQKLILLAQQLDEVVSKYFELRRVQSTLESGMALPGDKESDIEIPGIEQKIDEMQRAKQAEEELGRYAQIAAGQIKQFAQSLARLAVNAVRSTLNGIKSSIQGIGKSSESSNISVKKLVKTFIKYGFGVRSFFFLYRKLRKAITEGMEDLAKADPTGFGSTLDGLKASLENLKYAWVTAFAPILEYVAPVLNMLMNLLSQLAYAIAAFFATLTGKATVTLVKATKASTGLGKSLGKTGKAADDAKGKLADFDDLNIIGTDDKNGSGSGGGGGGGSGDGGVSLITETIESELTDLLKADKWFEIGQLFADKLNTLTESADEWINEKFRPWGVGWAQRLGDFLNGFIYHYDWALLGKTFADGLNAILDIANTWFNTVHFEWFGKQVATAILSAIENIDAPLIGETIANKLNAGIKFLYGLVTKLFRNGNAVAIGDTIATAVTSFFTTIEWDKAFGILVNGFTGIVSSLESFIKNFAWGKVGNQFAESFNTALVNIDSKKAGKAVSDFVNKVLDQFEKLDLVTFGEKIGNFLGSIDWLGIFTRVIADIGQILLGVIKGAFDGEFGDGLATIIAGALAGKLTIALGGKWLEGILFGSGIKSAGVGVGTKGGVGVLDFIKAGFGAGGEEGTKAVGLSLGNLALPAAGLLAYAAAWKMASDGQNEFIEGSKQRYGLQPEEQQAIQNIHEMSESLDEYHEASVRQHQIYNQEQDDILTMADAYTDLFDANGNVKKGMEQRAEYYKQQLASALGLEISQIDELMQTQGGLQQAIKDTITAKKKDAVATKYLDEYNNALRNSKKAEEQLKKAKENNTKAIERQKETQKAYDKAYKDYIEHVGQGAEVEGYYKRKLDEATLANSNAKLAVEETSEAIQDAETNYVRINTTMKNYEGYMAAIASGDAQKIEEAMKMMETSFITAETGTKDSLLRQANNMRQHYENLLQRMKEGDPTVTAEMVAEAKKWSDKADAELKKGLGNAGKDGMDALKKSFSDNAGGVTKGVTDAISKTVKALKGVMNGVSLGTPTMNLPTFKYTIDTVVNSATGVIKAISGWAKKTGTVKLAEGAVIPPNKEFMAILGDQKSGTNVEAPLTTIEDAVRNVLGEGYSNTSPEVIELLRELITVVRQKQLSISSREIGNAAIEEISAIKKRTGNNPIFE